MAKLKRKILVFVCHAKKLLKQKNNKRYVLYTLSIAILFVVVLTVYYGLRISTPSLLIAQHKEQSYEMMQNPIAKDMQNEKTTSKAINKVEYKLSTLSDEIKMLSRSIKNSNSEEINNKESNTTLNQLKSLALKINGLQNELQQNINSNKADLSSQMGENQQKTLLEIASLTKKFDVLKRIIMPPRYLSLRVLPFKVVGIDFWNGLPKVTVSIQGDYALMMNGQKRSGWTVVSIQTDPHRQVIFENIRHQKVRVML